MLKELFLAIILGALLGFGITGGYLAINKKNQPNNNNIVVTTPTIQPNQENSTQENTTVDKNNDGFSITTVDDMDIVSKENIEISGITTTPNNTIIVTIDSQIVNGTSDEEGKFSLQVKLNSGLNNIKVTAIDGNNNQFEKNLNITYSTATI